MSSFLTLTINTILIVLSFMLMFQAMKTLRMHSLKTRTLVYLSSVASNLIGSFAMLVLIVPLDKIDENQFGWSRLFSLSPIFLYFFIVCFVSIGIWFIFLKKVSWYEMLCLSLSCYCCMLVNIIYFIYIAAFFYFLFRMSHDIHKYLEKSFLVTGLLINLCTFSVIILLGYLAYNYNILNVGLAIYLLMLIVLFITIAFCRKSQIMFTNRPLLIMSVEVSVLLYGLLVCLPFTAYCIIEVVKKI